jgi:hypothetical protein
VYPDHSEQTLHEGFSDDDECIAYAQAVETDHARGYLAQRRGEHVDTPLALTVLAYIVAYPYCKAFSPMGAAILANAQVRVPIVAPEDVHDYRSATGKRLRRVQSTER